MFNINEFDAKAFQISFNAKVQKLAGAERITKAVLAELSREVLAQLHTNEDIRPVNTLLAALTPVNRKVATLYFKHFSGFKMDGELGTFTAKNKSTYDKARAQAEEFLSEDYNNIWTWAEKEVKVESKEFSLDAVTKGMENFLKKAKKNNIGRSNVLVAALRAGFTHADMLAAMQEMAREAEQANDEQAQAAA